MVGFDYATPVPTGRETLILHWNGTQWSIVPSANGPEGSSELHAVTAIAPNDVWAVGRYGAGYSLALTEHWDGLQWSVVPTPDDTVQLSTLNSVSAVASDDVWAVGNYSHLGLIVHWDGSQWSLVSAPPGGGNLSGVASDSTENVWAVGYVGYRGGQIERYNDRCSSSTPTLTRTRTNTPLVTRTPSYTRTSTPTSTVTPTRTNTPTQTLTPTFTPTFTITNTPFATPTCGPGRSVVPNPSIGTTSFLAAVNAVYGQLETSIAARNPLPSTGTACNGTKLPARVYHGAVSSIV